MAIWDDPVGAIGGFLEDKFSQDDVHAYKPDKKNFEYGAEGFGRDQYDQFAGQAQNAQWRGGPQAKMGQYEQDRLSQMQGRTDLGYAINQYKSMINNPNSYAQWQHKQNTDAAFRQQLAAARQGGYNPAAMRAAMGTGAQIQAEGARQAQMLQLQETQAGLQGLAQAATQQRAQDLQLMGMDAQTAQYQAMLELQQRGLNDRMTLGMYGLGQNALGQQLQGTMAYENLLGGGVNAASQANAQLDAQSDSSIIGMIGAGAMGALAFSDPATKSSVQPVGGSGPGALQGMLGGIFGSMADRGGYGDTARQLLAEGQRRRDEEAQRQLEEFNRQALQMAAPLGSEFAPTYGGAYGEAIAASDIRAKNAVAPVSGPTMQSMQSAFGGFGGPSLGAGGGITPYPGSMSPSPVSMSQAVSALGGGGAPAGAPRSMMAGFGQLQSGALPSGVSASGPQALAASLARRQPLVAMPSRQGAPQPQRALPAPAPDPTVRTPAPAMTRPAPTRTAGQQVPAQRGAAPPAPESPQRPAAREVEQFALSDRRSKDEIRRLEEENSLKDDILAMIGVGPRAEERQMQSAAPVQRGAESRANFASEEQFQAAAAQHYRDANRALEEQRIQEEAEAVRDAQAAMRGYQGRAVADFERDRLLANDARRAQPSVNLAAPGGPQPAYGAVPQPPPVFAPPPLGGAPSDERSKQRIQELEGIVDEYRSMLGGPSAPRPDVREPMQPPTARFADAGGDNPYRNLVAQQAQIPAYAFEYKPEVAEATGAYGRRVGTMADDLERVPITAPHVKRAPNGLKVVDTPQLTMTNTAVMGEMARMQEEQEERIRRLESGRSAVPYPSLY